MAADSTRLIEQVSGNIALTSVREKIESLENEWKKLPQVEVPVSIGTQEEYTPERLLFLRTRF